MTARSPSVLADLFGLLLTLAFCAIAIPVVVVGTLLTLARYACTDTWHWLTEPREAT